MTFDNITTNADLTAYSVFRLEAKGVIRGDVTTQSTVSSAGDLVHLKAGEFHGNLNVAGDLHDMSTSAVGSSIAVGGSVFDLSVDGNLSGLVRAGEVIRSLSVGGNMDAQIVGGEGIGDVSIEGEMLNTARVFSGIADPGADQQYGTADDILSAVDNGIKSVFAAAARGIIRAQTAIGTIRSTGDSSAQITAGTSLWKVEAEGDITGDIEASTGDVYYIITGGELTGKVTAGHHVGTVEAASINTTITAGGGINKIEATGNVDGSIQAVEDIWDVESLHGNVGADIESTSGSVRKVSAAIDITGDIKADLVHVYEVKAGGELTGKVTAGQHIGTIEAGVVNADVHAGKSINKITTTGNIAGTINAAEKIYHVIAGGQLTSNVTAGLDIGTVQASGISSTITSQAGGIYWVKALGEAGIQGMVHARTAITYVTSWIAGDINDTRDVLADVISDNGHVKLIWTRKLPRADQNIKAKTGFDKIWVTNHAGSGDAAHPVVVETDTGLVPLYEAGVLVTTSRDDLKLKIAGVEL